MRKSLLLLSSLSLFLTACDNYNGTKDHKNVERHSETEADRMLAQKIRDAVASDEAVSPEGKKIRVIVVNGVVTLRGTVKNENEKNEIAGKIKSIQGVKNIDNQLEAAQA